MLDCQCGHTLRKPWAQCFQEQRKASVKLRFAEVIKGFCGSTFYGRSTDYMMFSKKIQTNFLAIALSRQLKTLGCKSTVKHFASCKGFAEFPLDYFSLSMCCKCIYELSQHSCLYGLLGFCRSIVCRGFDVVGLRCVKLVSRLYSAIFYRNSIYSYLYFDYKNLHSERSPRFGTDGSTAWYLPWVFASIYQILNYTYYTTTWMISTFQNYSI